MAYDTQGFVHKIESYPDLLVICGLPSVFDELNRIVQAKLEFPNLLSYDATFNLGDIYVSPFLFRYVVFESSPVIPAAYLLHERKFETAHEAFMTFIKAKLSSLSNVQAPIPIFTDDEKAVCNSIDKALTGVVCVSC